MKKETRKIIWDAVWMILLMVITALVVIAVMMVLMPRVEAQVLGYGPFLGGTGHPSWYPTSMWPRTWWEYTPYTMLQPYHTYLYYGTQYGNCALNGCSSIVAQDWELQRYRMPW